MAFWNSRDPNSIYKYDSKDIEVRKRDHYYDHFLIYIPEKNLPDDMTQEHLPIHLAANYMFHHHDAMRKDRNIITKEDKTDFRDKPRFTASALKEIASGTTLYRDDKGDHRLVYGRFTKDGESMVVISPYRYKDVYDMYDTVLHPYTPQHMEILAKQYPSNGKVQFAYINTPLIASDYSRAMETHHRPSSNMPLREMDRKTKYTPATLKKVQQITYYRDILDYEKFGKYFGEDPPTPPNRIVAREFDETINNSTVDPNATTMSNISNNNNSDYTPITHTNYSSHRLRLPRADSPPRYNTFDDEEPEWMDPDEFYDAVSSYDQLDPPVYERPNRTAPPSSMFNGWYRNTTDSSHTRQTLIEKNNERRDNGLSYNKQLSRYAPYHNRSGYIGPRKEALEEQTDQFGVQQDFMDFVHYGWIEESGNIEMEFMNMPLDNDYQNGRRSNDVFVKAIHIRTQFKRFSGTEATARLVVFYVNDVLTHEMQFPRGFDILPSDQLNILKVEDILQKSPVYYAGNIAELDFPDLMENPTCLSPYNFENVVLNDRIQILYDYYVDLNCQGIEGLAGENVDTMDQQYTKVVKLDNLDLHIRYEPGTKFPNRGTIGAVWIGDYGGGMVGCNSWFRVYYVS